MKMMLLGANGRTGREIIGQALDAGHEVTALVRHEDRLADVSHPQLTVHTGSACDAPTLEALLPGQDLVISVLGPRWPTRAAASVYPDSARAIVTAMQRASVRRLLVTSSALLFPANGWLARLLQRLVPNIVRGAGHMEEQIRASELDWTIARTSFLNDAPAMDYRTAADALPEGGGAVSRAGVARFLLAEATEPRHVRRVVGLCG